VLEPAVGILTGTTAPVVPADAVRGVVRSRVMRSAGSEY